MHGYNAQDLRLKLFEQYLVQTITIKLLLFTATPQRIRQYFQFLFKRFESSCRLAKLFMLCAL